MNAHNLRNALTMGFLLHLPVHAQTLRYRGFDILPVGGAATSQVQLMPSGNAPSGQAVRASRVANLPPGTDWGLTIRGLGAGAIGAALDLQPQPGAVMFCSVRGTLGATANADLGRSRLRRLANGRFELQPFRPQVQTTGAIVQVFAGHELAAVIPITGFQQAWTIEWPDTVEIEHWDITVPIDLCQIIPDWWTPPCPNEVFHEILDLDTLVSIDVAGLPPVVGDQIRIIAQGPTAVSGLEQMTFTSPGTSLPAIDLLELGSGAFGAGVSALGNVLLDREPADLLVTGITTVGSGMVVHWGRARCAMLELPDGLPLDNGGTMALRLVGARAGQEGVVFGELRAAAVGNDMQLRQDFSGLFPSGNGTFDIQVFDQGVETARIRSVVLASNVVIVEIPRGPIVIINDYIRREEDHPDTTGDLGGLGIGGRLQSTDSVAVQIRVALGGGQFRTVMGDEFRIRPVVDLMDFDHISDLELRNTAARATPVQLRIGGLPFADMPSLFMPQAGGSYGQNTLRVNGSVGGVGRRVGIALGQPIQVSSTIPGGFLCVHFGVPDPMATFVRPGLPEMLFDPAAAAVLPGTSFTIPHPGLGLTLAVQAIHLDPTQLAGFGISNAVLVDLHIYNSI